jgi:hypothetical protein
MLKILLQQFGKRLGIFFTTWEKPASSAQIYARSAWLASQFLVRWEGEKRNK